MNRWPTKPLGELCEVQIGRTPRRDEPRFWRGNAVWVTVAELDGGTITSSKENISEAAISECMADAIPPGTLLFSFKLSIGKMAVAGCPLYTNEAIAALPIRNPNRISRDFLRYALMAEPREGGADAAVLGKVLNKRKVSQLAIPVPPITEQERIVKLLDEADALRKLRAQADRRTADLIPALFHDMFGDPATNPHDWPVKEVGELFDQQRGGAKCGPFGSSLKKHEYTEEGVPVWGIPNVLPNQFVEQGSLFVSPSKYIELQAYAVEPGDLLISRAGTVGRICVARPKARASIMGTNLIKLSVNQEVIVPEFFATLMTHFAANAGRLRANSDEGAYSFVNTTALKRLRIYVPPLDLQSQFALQAAEIRELETSQAASRERLDALFQSMLHRAFHGDL